MLLVLVVASGLVALWATWLIRARTVPGWLRFVAPLTVASTLINGYLTLSGLKHAFLDIGHANAAERASNLARDISNAMIPTLIATITIVIAIAILVVYTVRAKRRGVETPRMYTVRSTRE